MQLISQSSSNRPLNLKAKQNVKRTLHDSLLLKPLQFSTSPVLNLIKSRFFPINEEEEEKNEEMQRAGTVSTVQFNIQDYLTEHIESYFSVNNFHGFLPSLLISRNGVANFPHSPKTLPILYLPADICIDPAAGLHFKSRQVLVNEKSTALLDSIVQEKKKNVVFHGMIEPVERQNSSEPDFIEARKDFSEEAKTVKLQLDEKEITRSHDVARAASNFLSSSFVDSVVVSPEIVGSQTSGRLTLDDIQERLEQIRQMEYFTSKKYITKLLHQCASIEAIEALVEEFQPDFDDICASTALHRFAQISIQQRGSEYLSVAGSQLSRIRYLNLLTKLVRTCSDHLHEMRTWSISCVAWACAHLDWAPSWLWVPLAKAVRVQVSEFTTSELTATAWAFVKLTCKSQFTDPTTANASCQPHISEDARIGASVIVMQAVFSRIEPDDPFVSYLTPKELSLLTWCCARIPAFLTRGHLQQLISLMTPTMLRQWNRSDVCRAAWSIAYMTHGEYCGKPMNYLFSIIAYNLGRITLRELTMVVQTMALLKEPVWPESLKAATEQEVASRIELHSKVQLKSRLAALGIQPRNMPTELKALVSARLMNPAPIARASAEIQGSHSAQSPAAPRVLVPFARYRVKTLQLRLPSPGKAKAGSEQGSRLLVPSTQHKPSTSPTRSNSAESTGIRAEPFAEPNRRGLSHRAQPFELHMLITITASWALLGYRPSSRTADLVTSSAAQALLRCPNTTGVMALCHIYSWLEWRPVNLLLKLLDTLISEPQSLTDEQLSAVAWLVAKVKAGSVPHAARNNAKTKLSKVLEQIIPPICARLNRALRMSMQTASSTEQSSFGNNHRLGTKQSSGNGGLGLSDQQSSLKKGDWEDDQRSKRPPERLIVRLLHMCADVKHKNERFNDLAVRYIFRNVRVLKPATVLTLVSTLARLQKLEGHILSSLRTSFIQHMHSGAISLKQLPVLISASIAFSEVLADGGGALVAVCDYITEQSEYTSYNRLNRYLPPRILAPFLVALAQHHASTPRFMYVLASIASVQAHKMNLMATLKILWSLAATLTRHEGFMREANHVLTNGAGYLRVEEIRMVQASYARLQEPMCGLQDVLEQRLRALTS